MVMVVLIVILVILIVGGLIGAARSLKIVQQFEQGMRGGRWRVASDLNWRRLKYWRRLLKQEFEAFAGTQMAQNGNATDQPSTVIIEQHPAAAQATAHQTEPR